MNEGKAITLDAFASEHFASRHLSEAFCKDYALMKAGILYVIVMSW